MQTSQSRLNKRLTVRSQVRRAKSSSKSAATGNKPPQRKPSQKGQIQQLLAVNKQQTSKQQTTAKAVEQLKTKAAANKKRRKSLLLNQSNFSKEEIVLTNQQDAESSLTRNDATQKSDVTSEHPSQKLYTPREPDNLIISDVQIQDNICKSNVCNARGKPHRHQIPACKQHSYCVADPLVEQMPIHSKVPLSLPFTDGMGAVTNNAHNKTFDSSKDSQSGHSKYLAGVERRAHGETGPQQPGYKTVPTAYSLDHYWAQQWKLDIDNMPPILPPELATVQKLFGAYSRRGIPQVQMKSSSKPTLQKKLNQWQKAKQEMEGRKLELMYWHSNQDPKVYALLKQYIKDNPQPEDQQSTNQNKTKVGKRSDLDQLRLDTEKDMIPISYPETMKLEPAIYQLSKEHEDIVKMQTQNPQAKFSELTATYYDKKEKKEKDEFKRKVMNARSNVETENYLPSCKAVQSRMESDHLNSWMLRSEIQETAERFIQYKKMVSKIPADKLHQYRQAQSMSQQVQRGGIRTHPVSAANKQLQGKSYHSGAILIDSPSQLGNKSVLSTSKAHDNNKSSKHQQIDCRSYTASKQSGKPGRPLSTSASTSFPRHNAFRQTPQSKMSGSAPRRVRLFSAKPVLQDQDEAIDAGSSSGCYAQQDGGVFTSTRGSLILNQDGAKYLSESRNKTQSVNNLISVGGAKLTRLHDQLNAATHTQTQANIKQFQSHGGGTALQTPKKTQSYTIMVKNQNRQVGSSQVNSQININNNDLLLQENDLADLANGPLFEEDMFHSTHQMINPRSRVFSELVEADERGKGHIGKMFKQAKWQKEKDNLIASMNFHLTKHRAKIKMGHDQELRRSELSSHSKFGQSLLHKRLSHQYGIKNIPEVELPKECQIFLSEANHLMQDKELQDAKLHQARANSKNPCTSAALSQKDFETLQRSTQMSEGHVKKLAPRVKTDLVSDYQSDMVLTESVQKDVEKSKLEPPCSNVPRDPRPDVYAISASRIDLVKSDLVNKIATRQKQPQADWVIQAQDKLQDNAGKSVMTKTSAHPANQTATQPNTVSMRQLSRSTIRKATTVQQPSAFQTHASKRSTSQLYKASIATTQCFVQSSLEPVSPGIGAPARGSALTKITNEILQGLDESLDDEPYESALQELTMPELDWDTMKLNSHIKDMESSDFWQQKGLLCARQGQVDASMDYYRQGLRKNPNDYTLIYSLAVCFCQLKKYQSALQWFSRGINLHPRWIDGLCGITISYFNMQQFDRALHFITLAKENFKGGKISNAKLSLEIISLIQATCLKQTNALDFACRNYQALEEYFIREQGKYVMTLLWGMILIPLSSERKTQANHYSHLKEYLEHLNDAKIPQMDGQNLLLSRFCLNALKDHKGFTIEKLMYQDFTKEPKKLDFVHFPKSIWALINSKSFFKRFKDMKLKDHDLYETILHRAEVELYAKDQPIFLKDRVGIVTMGSVEIRSHNEINLMRPIIIKKAIEGDIIGFAEGDERQSTSPMTWIVAMQNQSEVIFLSQDDFKQLWNLQQKFTEQQIVLQKLGQNKYFQRLHMVTKYHLIYESLEMKMFFPGQLIMSVNQRSPLCPEFEHLFKDGTSKFRRDIDNKIMKQQEPNQSLYTGMLSQLNTKDGVSKSGQAKSTINMASGRHPIGSIDQDGEEVTHGKSRHNDGITEFSDETDADADGSSSKRHKRSKTENAKHRLEKLEQIKKVMDLETDSNSTDYGLQHAITLVNQQPPKQLKTSESKDSFDLQISDNSDQDQLMGITETNQDQESVQYAIDESSLERESNENQRVSKQPKKNGKIKTGTAQLNKKKSEISFDQQPILKQSKTGGKFSSPNPRLSNKQRAAQFQGSKTKTQVLSQSVSPETKRSIKMAKTSDLDFTNSVTPFGAQQAQKKDWRRGSTEGDQQQDEGPMRSKLNSKNDKRSSTLKVQKSQMVNTSREKVLTFQAFPPQNTIIDFESKTAVRGANKKSKTKEQDALNNSTKYKFLLQKQIARLQSGCKETRGEHKHYKRQMKVLLRHVTTVYEELAGISDMQKNKHRLDEILKPKLDFAQTLEDLKNEKIANPGSAAESAGVYNFKLISELSSKIGTIAESVGLVEGEGNYQKLFESIVQAIEVTKHDKTARVEAKGVHFIDTGEVLVVGKTKQPNTRLNKSDSFGICDLIKKPGPEYLGDVRAGIRPCQTFFFSYSELKKRLSIPEKIRLQSMESMDERMEGVMRYVARRDGIDEAKLRKY